MRGSTLLLLVGSAWLVPTWATSVTFELEANESGTYDAIVSQEPGDPPIFAVDMFIRASDGALISIANNNGNPFDEPTGNDNPPGNPGAILIGGSDISGFCDAGGRPCFGDFQCDAGDQCIIGRRGTIELGEISWNEKGTLSLARGSACGTSTLSCPLPVSNLSGCQLINGEEVLAGADSWPVNDPNGIANRCECGDANGDGFISNSDLVLLFQCRVGDPFGTTETCRTRLHQGEANNDGLVAGGDMVRVFQAIVTGNSTGNVCPARPEPVE